MKAKAIILLTMHAFQRMLGKGSPSIKLNALQIEKRDEVAMKVASGAYGIEEVACLNCGGADAEVIAERDRYGLYFSVKLCKSCGLAYTSPRMDGRAYGQFYDDEYRPLYVGAERAGDAFYIEQKRQGQRIIHYLKEQNISLDKPFKVLEVGCGAGGILAVFKEMGHQVLGLDLGSEYVNYGRDKYGLDLRVSYLSDLDSEFKPDLIIYSHVMEHILDPMEEMREIFRRCDPNTLVYIEVPGLKNIHRAYQMDVMKYYQNAHAVHFTLSSLMAMMNKCGFGLIAGDENVHAVFRVNSETIAFENEYSSTRSYLLQTEKNRWKYPFTMRAMKGEVKRWLRKLRG